jgi:hypothetical protein
MPRNRLAPALRRHGMRCRVAFLLLSGLPILAPAVAAGPHDAVVALPVSDQRLTAHVAEAAQRFRIPEDWIRAVIGAESAHNVRAVSSAGAMGLMQIMPETWTELRARYWFGDDPFDPRDNILAGTAYLREMLDRYGTIGAMLAAYNAGPGRYDEYLAIGRPLPTETRAYVAKLAPILAGEALSDGASTSPQRASDWREAPLFVGPSDGGSFADSLLSGGQSASAPAAGFAPGGRAATAPGGSIFVGRSAEQTPR